MKRFSLVIVFLSLLLSGCGVNVRSKVTSFHNLTAQDYVGASYAVATPSDKEGDMEYQTYARMLTQRLVEAGVKTTSLESADYIIFMSYGMGESFQQISSYDTYGQTGTKTEITGIRHYGNYSTVDTQEVATYGKTGTATTSTTLHTRLLALHLFDMRVSPPSPVYKARVISQGSNAEISVVMPAMLESVIKHFPGEPGKTVTYELPLEK